MQCFLPSLLRDAIQPFMIDSTVFACLYPVDRQRCIMRPSVGSDRQIKLLLLLLVDRLTS
jgi:hypothetical protein